MQNIIDELFDYITKAENFNAVCELIDETNKIKYRLLNNLGDKIASDLNTKINKSEWYIVREHEFGDLGSEINIFYLKDKQKRFCYSIVNDKDGICLCVWINRSKYSSKELTNLFTKARELKEEYDWKLGDENESSWPLSFYLEDSSFKSLSAYTKILPANLDYYVTHKIVNEIVTDLNSSIKEFLPFLK